MKKIFSLGLVLLLFCLFTSVASANRANYEIYLDYPFSGEWELQDNATSSDGNVNYSYKSNNYEGHGDINHTLIGFKVNMGKQFILKLENLNENPSNYFYYPIAIGSKVFQNKKFEMDIMLSDMEMDVSNNEWDDVRISGQTIGINLFYKITESISCEGNLNASFDDGSASNNMDRNSYNIDYIENRDFLTYEIKINYNFTNHLGAHLRYRNASFHEDVDRTQDSDLVTDKMKIDMSYFSMGLSYNF